MSKHTTTFVAAKPHFGSWRLPGLLTLGAALSAAAGLACFWAHQQAEAATSLRASAGLILCLAAILQVRTAWIVAHRPHSPRVLGFSKKLFRRALFVGIVGAYVAALVVGPMPGVKEIFIAASITWYTTLLLPLTATPETVANWRKLVGRPQIRRTGLALYWLVLLAVNFELGLRAYQYYSGDAPLAAAVNIAAPTAVAQAAEVTPAAGDAPHAALPGRGQLRVAALGDEVTLAGNAQTNHLKQLSRFMPGVEVSNWGSPKAGPQDYATAMFHQATRTKPDLMLVFVSVGDDITAETTVPSAFDWQALQISQLVTRNRTGQERKIDWTESMADSQEFLRTRSPQLAVCRTPIDDRMHRCWKQSLGHLTQLIDRCRKEKLPLALVVVPAEFQVNSALCDTLRRRNGYEAKEVDVQLPQRRLAAFAQQQDVAMLDLLPFLVRSEESPYQRNGYVWNATGHQIAAEAVGGWLQSKYANHVAAATTLTASR